MTDRLFADAFFVRGRGTTMTMDQKAVKGLSGRIWQHGWFAALTLVASTAQAQLATNVSIDVRALSLGNAVTADPPSISSVHYNPAGLSRLEGRRIDYQLLGVTMGMKTEFTAPPGYGVFGYSDDPVVCADDPANPSPVCNDFKTGKSQVRGVALYIPIMDEVVDLPPGPLAAPMMAFSIRPPGSRFTFANAMYAPLAAGLYKAPDDPGNFLGERVALERITLLSPSVAYQINDTVSVGASVGFSYQAMALETEFRSPNELLGFARLVDEEICAPFKEESNFVIDLFFFGVCNAKESIGPYKSLAHMNLTMQQTVSPTYNLGVLWDATDVLHAVTPDFVRPLIGDDDELSWGAVWQSQAKMHLTGKFAVEYANGTRSLFNAIGGSVTGSLLLQILGMPTYLAQEETGQLSMDLTYPAHFQTGISYKVQPNLWKFRPRLKFNVDIGWTDYGKWDAFNINFDRPLGVLKIARLLAPGTTPTSLSMPLGYQSVWSMGFGMEYMHTDRLKLRVGYEPRRSAIPDDKRSSLVPINDAVLIGSGIGYQWDKETELDLTLAYLTSHDRIPANTSCNVNCTGLNHVVYNPYAGLNVETEASILIMGIGFRTTW